MKKSIYTAPQTDVVIVNASINYLLTNWSAEDGTGGDNTPEANEWEFDENEHSFSSNKSLWDSF